MRIKAVYQSGIPELIDRYKKIDGVTGWDFGNKAHSLWQYCSISFHITNIRGFEIVILKEMASSLKLITTGDELRRTFEIKPLRNTMFSNAYPSVIDTPEYTMYQQTLVEITAKHKLLNNNDGKISRDFELLNFAGALTYSAFVTFSGTNISTILGTFIKMKLTKRDGTFIHPDDPEFINMCIATLSNKVYERMEGTFSSLDIYTDISMKQTPIALIDGSMLSTPSRDFLIDRVIFNEGVLQILGADRSVSAPSIIKDIKEFRNNIGIHEKSNLKDEAKFVVHARCNVRSLIYLILHSDIVTYYTDMKNVMGTRVEDLNCGCFSKKCIENEKQSMEIVKCIEDLRFFLIARMKKDMAEMNRYEELRQSGSPVKRPVSMLQKTEFYNTIPLYGKVYTTLTFTKRQFEELEKYVSSDGIDLNTATDLNGIFEFMSRIIDIVTAVL